MPTALITGGSSGIGLELSRHFAKDGFNLMVVAYGKEELENLKSEFGKSFPKIKVDTLQLDLSQAGSAQSVYDWSKKGEEEISVLVNSAGFGTFGAVQEIDKEQEKRMIGLNVLSLYELNRLFLNDMEKRNRGKIANISSIAAFQPNPFFATYGATKAFVYNFSRALRYELKERGSNVKVITICPPATRTPFVQAAKMQNANTFEGFGTLDVDVVAKDSYMAIKSSKDLLIPGFGLRFVSSVFNRLPTFVRMKLVRDHLQEK